jgi:hypothetical protein
MATPIYRLEMHAQHWMLVHEASGRVVRRYRTRREGLSDSVSHVANRGGMLVVHRRDGGVQEMVSYKQPDAVAA